MTLEQPGLGLNPPNGSSQERGATVISRNFNDIKAFLYIYDMLQKTLVEPFFQIPIKTFFIEVLLVKAFWLKALLQEAMSNRTLVGETNQKLRLFTLRILKLRSVVYTLNLKKIINYLK